MLLEILKNGSFFGKRKRFSKQDANAFVMNRVDGASFIKKFVIYCSG